MARSKISSSLEISILFDLWALWEPYATFQQIFRNGQSSVGGPSFPEAAKYTKFNEVMGSEGLFSLAILAARAFRGDFLDLLGIAKENKPSSP